MRPDRILLIDMLVAARDAVSFLDGCSFEQFQEDRMRQLAVVKAVEVVGEAASKLSEEFRSGHSELPWREIVGMRYRLVHDYFGIDLEQVWNTVHEDLSGMIDIVDKWVSSGDGE
jgi:uncharacterized protein with HEPN domain